MQEKTSKVMVVITVLTMAGVLVLLDSLGWTYTKLGNVTMALLFAATAIAFANLQKFEKGFPRIFSLFASVLIGISSLMALSRVIWP